MLNYNFFSGGSKLLLSFMMIAGRLELFTLIMLFFQEILESLSLIRGTKMYFHARTIARITGLIMTITGLAMIPPFLFALYYNDSGTALSLAVSCMASVIPGALMYFFLRGSKKGLQVRDGYLTVTICWATCSLFGRFAILAFRAGPFFYRCLL